MMAHKIGGATGVLRHDERTEHDKVESRKNECIKPEKTHLNYNLAPERRLPLSKHLEKTCSENNIRLNKRKDLNVMVSWIITVPKDLPEPEHKLFFKSCYDFLTQRYGGQNNVISATVHLDETTPHLHFNFIPVGIDKNGNKTVSSKLVCTRKDLQAFHNDLERHLESVLGHRVNILNEATKEGNKSIEELKKGTAAAELKAIKNQIKAFKGVIITADEINKIQPQKTLTGQIKGVSIEEIENLKKTALRGILAEKKVIQLEKENAHLKTQIPSVKDKLKYAELKSLNALIEKNPQLKQLIKQSAVNKKNISKER